QFRPHPRPRPLYPGPSGADRPVRAGRPPPALRSPKGDKSELKSVSHEKARIKTGHQTRSALTCAILRLLRWLPTRFRDWFCNLLEPLVETRRAESRVILGNQRPLAHRNAVVAPVRIRDHLAGIVKRRQGPSGEFIQVKLFRPPDFNRALHR